MDPYPLIREASSRGRVVVLTGAGISAESGIPTFRGSDGIWKVGSRNYYPQEMATFDMFTRHPEQLWPWYLYRRETCLKAKPNAAHRALKRLEDALTDRFLLVTQNVDGLHARAGSTAARTYTIHGDLNWMRCGAECRLATVPVPEALTPQEAHGALTDQDKELLSCPHCGEWMRPHVLWFDECYDEARYRFESSLRATSEAALLLVIGTSGATNLPAQMGSMAARQGATIVDINVDANPFAELAQSLPNGSAITGPAGDIVPKVVDAILES